MRCVNSYIASLTKSLPPSSLPITPQVVFFQRPVAFTNSEPMEVGISYGYRSPSLLLTELPSLCDPTTVLSSHSPFVAGIGRRRKISRQTHDELERARLDVLVSSKAAVDTRDQVV